MGFRFRAILILAIVLLSSAAALLRAQKKGEDPNVRTVEGLVSDEAGNHLGDAVVQLKNTKTLQVRSFHTQSDGQYRFQGLSTNVDYELKAIHGQASSRSRTLSSFDSRKRAIIDLRIESKK
jgi:hypothetical protein